jgi:DNA adenine methylase
MHAPLKSPIPYYGGKSTIAAQVWQWFGDVGNFVDPFVGSAAVLFQRPGYAPEYHLETLNDLDGMVCNAWRSLRYARGEVAYWCDVPVMENEYHAVEAWLVGRKDSLQAQIEGDPDWYDAKVAGRWIWGMACHIGSEFCSGKGPWQVVDGQLVRTGETAANGVDRRRVHLGDRGRGIHRKRVHLGGGIAHSGNGIHAKQARGEGLYAWMDALSARLRYVRVCCGDWTRVMGPSVTWHHGTTGIFLDPPYEQSRRDSHLYTVETNVSAAVRQWCVENGHNPLLRIVLCGTSDEHDALLSHGWHKWTWTANGGYGNQGKGRGRENREKEACWVSPNCIFEVSPQMELF